MPKSMVGFRSLIVGAIGAVLIAAPGQAAQLQFWRYETNANRLVFTTDDGVQPRAQFIPNPSRVVIDLPGTTLRGAPTAQAVGGAVREVRVGQFDAQTARIVVEFNPGYTVDPQQVLVRGTTPTEWTVQFPEAEQVAIAPPVTPSPSSRPASPTPRPASQITAQPSAPSTSGGLARIEGVRLTPDGIFLRSTGTPSRIDVDRIRRRQEIEIDIEGAAIAPEFTQRQQTIDHLGVNELEIEQRNETTVRITLSLDDRDDNWQATASNLGGIVLVPAGRTATASDRPQRITRNDSPSRTPNSSTVTPSRPADSSTAVIQSVQLSRDQTQLIIQGDRALRYQSGWDQSQAAYRVTVPSARLAEQIVGPELSASSSLLQVRLREDEDQNVSILTQPASGVDIGGVSQPNPQTLVVQLRRRTASTVPPVGRPPTSYPTTGELPRAQNGQTVVVIDPGHGGPDPGAIGIGGLREVDIVLPIGLEVASILERQGVNVVLTRRDDRDLDLEPRVQIASRANADLFVSIHANAIDLSRPDVNGLETYYYSDRGLGLAQAIHRSVIQVPGTRDRGVRQARFYVLRNTSMPAVLVETGFVTGSSDARLLSDPQFRSQMALAIARGILQYIQQNL